MAKNMSFSLRWGNSCGTPFLKDKFCQENREWAYLQNYLEDRPQQQWTTFSITKKTNGKSIKRKTHRPRQSKKSQK